MRSKAFSTFFQTFTNDWLVDSMTTVEKLRSGSHFGIGNNLNLYQRLKLINVQGYNLHASEHLYFPVFGKVAEFQKCKKVE